MKKGLTSKSSLSSSYCIIRIAGGAQSMFTHFSIENPGYLERFGKKSYDNVLVIHCLARWTLLESRS